MVQDRLIPLSHPNRDGRKLRKLMAIVIHYTGNDRPGADDEMTAGYFARGWKGKKESPMELDGSPFRYGSAHIIADMDSIIQAIPEDEIGYHCGENIFLPKNNGYNGRQPVAHKIFQDLPNHFTIGVEICNNDVIPNSNEDWNKACSNAISWVKDFLKKNNLLVDVNASLSPQLQTAPPADGVVWLLRHHDVTGKECPAPMVVDYNMWADFVRHCTE